MLGAFAQVMTIKISIIILFWRLMSLGEWEGVRDVSLYKINDFP